MRVKNKVFNDKPVENDKELVGLLKQVLQGKISRRAFLGRAAAFGVAATVASNMLSVAAHAQGPKRGGRLKLGLGGGATSDSLDPARALSQVPVAVIALFGETIVQVAPSGDLDLRIAEDYSASPDAKVWSFKIRQGVEFHNGKTLSADDVLKTMQRHSDETYSSGALGLMRGVESMRAKGDIFEVTLKEGNVDLPYLFGDKYLVIQPGGGFDDPTAGVGSGPYKLVDNEPGVRLEFERFANYWDDTRGHFDAVEIIVINDATARMSALQTGLVHMANLIPPKIAHLLERSKGVVLEPTKGRGFNEFVMQVDSEPFNNNDLRLALKYAINREEMVVKILHGYGSVGNDMPINDTYPLFDASIPLREFDLDKAAEHYKKSGHDGTPIVLRVADTAFPGAVDAAQLYQQTAKKAGIPISIKRMPDDGYWSDVWNKEPFSAVYWNGRPTQDQMYSLAYLSSADWNDTNFDNEKFDELLVEARREFDPVRRKEIYSEMGYLVRDVGGSIVPMFNHFLDAHSDQIAGWEGNPNGDMMDSRAPLLCWMA